MKKTLNQTGKESKTISRDEIYSCFCTKLNETFKSKGFIKMCINSFCGSPVYVIFSLFFLTITTIAAIVTLSLLNTQTSVAKINRSYFMNCSLNSDCDNLKGLQCSSQNSLCNCPAVKTKGYCDCSVGYYWSGVECKRLMQYLDVGCAANYMCDNTKYLQCLNKTCKCDPLKIFDRSLQTCRYNYIGCFSDSTSLIYSITSLYRMIYFIDICINGCKYKNIPYSGIFTSGFKSYCYCLNSYTTTSPQVLCDQNCYGKSGESNPCGSTWGSYRAIYSNNGY